MSKDVPFEIESPLTSEVIEAKSREYKAMREQAYADAIARLEDASIEPLQQAAYDATLTTMLALPLKAVSWPADDPRMRLHTAMEYGDKLEQRRVDIEKRFSGKLALAEMFAIKRYALTALHAFKQWRANPEPDDSFSKIVRNAARLRRTFLLHLETFTVQGLRCDELMHFDGGVTPESIACDLFVLMGALERAPADWRNRLYPTPVVFMEATLLAKALLKHAASNHVEPQLWLPTLLYARAYSLVDRASFWAELALSELHNAERDPDHVIEWQPECLFCSGPTERQRHHRENESAKDARRRAQFISSTMTTALRRQVVEN